MCWLEATTLTRKNARCDVTNEPLEKGEQVIAHRYFNGSHDLQTVPLVARSVAFANDAHTRANAEKYRTDGYALSDFVQDRRYRHPWINATLFEAETFELDRALDFLSAPPVHPTPYYLRSTGDVYQKGPERRIAHGANRALVDFLWMLVKCGYLEGVLRRLPELPRHFGLTLMLLDRPELRARVASALGVPSLVDVYAIMSKPRLGAEDIAALARFGREHPEFRALLAQSLTTYEYHLYSNYSPSPNWFFQDFHYVKRARAGHFLFLLADEPDLLAPLASMLELRCVVAGGGTSADIEYGNMQSFFYGAALLHSALRGGDDLSFWRSFPERFPRLRDLAKTQQLVLKAASLV